MSQMMQWILYAVLIVVLGVVGYYMGETYTALTKWGGMGLGVAAGVLVSGIIWYTQMPESDESEVKLSWE